LQRTAGNQAVSELVREATIPPLLWLQRYEAGEHAQFGAKEGEKEQIFDINGVKVPYGHMIALGDFYENFDQIKSAPKEELQQLVDLIDRDKKHFQGVRGVKAISNDEWQKATEGRKWHPMRPPLYLDLAGKNEAHFAVANKKEWLKYHSEAVHQSQKGNLTLAQETNAFGDHFLTDAFSAGHLFKKSRVVEEAKANLTDPKKFAGLVADCLLANPAAKATLSEYETSPAPWSLTWNPINRDSLADIVEFIRAHKEDKYYSMFARAVHDRLNRMAERGKDTGVLVQNFKTRWHLSGDETLNAKTREIAQAAVAQSRQNVQESFKNDKVDFDEIVDRVWDFVPRPVDEGEAAVKDAEKTLTDPTNPQTSAAVAEIAIDNLPMMISELTSAHMLRKRQPAPVLRPAFPGYPYGVPIMPLFGQ
jgi:hypothetical protein